MAIKPDGEKVARLRNRLGLTQQELADDAGYSKRTVERIESGADTNRSTLEDIAMVFKVRVELLMYVEEGESLNLSAPLDIVIREDFYESPEEAQEAMVRQLLTMVRDARAINIRYGSIILTVLFTERDAFKVRKAFREGAFVEWGVVDVRLPVKDYATTFAASSTPEHAFLEAVREQVSEPRKDEVLAELVTKLYAQHHAKMLKQATESFSWRSTAAADAEDIVHEVFAELVVRLKREEKGYLTSLGSGRMGVMLANMVRWKTNAFTRRELKKNPTNKLPREVIEEIEDVALSNAADHAEMVRDLHELIDVIYPILSEQEALVLNAMLDGESMKEISDSLGIDISKLSRMRRRITDLLSRRRDSQ